MEKCEKSLCILNFKMNTLRLTQLRMYVTCYIFIRNNEFESRVMTCGRTRYTVLNDVGHTMWAQTEPRSWFYIINELNIIFIIGL